MVKVSFSRPSVAIRDLGRFTPSASVQGSLFMVCLTFTPKIIGLKTGNCWCSDVHGREHCDQNGALKMRKVLECKAGMQREIPCFATYPRFKKQTQLSQFQTLSSFNLLLTLKNFCAKAPAQPQKLPGRRKLTLQHLNPAHL